MCPHMIQSHTPSAWSVLLKLLHISFQICIWALQLWMFTTVCRTSAICSEALHSTRNCRSVHAYQYFLSAGVLLDPFCEYKHQGRAYLHMQEHHDIKSHWT